MMAEIASNPLVLSSIPKNIAHIEPYVERVVREFDINSELYGNILISVTEAVTNAIVHGNHSDASKKVTVEMEKHPKNIVFKVTDEGDGFEPETLPDPTAPENLLELGGRGVFLMKQLSDLVIFSDNGRTVEIQFKI